VEGALGDERFTADLAAFVAPLVAPGRVNGLAQALLKLLSPGVPDLYQGSELWTDGLVDPDNRRPVDFARRCRLLDELTSGGPGPEELLSRADEGLPKLAVTARALEVRRRHPELFVPGPAAGYHPVDANGSRADHVVAFARGAVPGTPGEAAAVVVVPRLPLRLEAAGGWGDTTVTLPPGRWRHELIGGSVGGGARPLAELLAPFPVALLTAEAVDR
jgi:(1->4)-alpha-D-glucan 1-alpha-D-glucosylmutase